MSDAFSKKKSTVVEFVDSDECTIPINEDNTIQDDVVNEAQYKDNDEDIIILNFSDRINENNLAHLQHNNLKSILRSEKTVCQEDNIFEVVFENL